MTKARHVSRRRRAVTRTKNPLAEYLAMLGVAPSDIDKVTK